MKLLVAASGIAVFFSGLVAQANESIGFRNPGITIPTHHLSDYVAPKKSSDKVVVIDAYEKNPINWTDLKKNPNLRAFIGKASDGLAPPWTCSGKTGEARTLCNKTFQNYHLKKELYHTRKTMAKAMGLKWGAYHLGRPGNPIEQAYHFLQFADPQPDELIALDIEHDDPEKWISFADAERFARYIHARIGRYPVLYTNHDTARRIAAQRHKYPLLSRLPLWYARFKSDIRGVFPMGNWDSYALWQFSARPNCNKRRCLYRINGTQPDIDVNATGLTAEQFDAAWPFDGLVPEKPLLGPFEILVASIDIGNSGNRFEYIDVVRSRINPAVVRKTRRHKRLVLRYRVDYSFEDDDGETVKLATIAVPTPTPVKRKPVLDVIPVQGEKAGVTYASVAASGTKEHVRQADIEGADEQVTASANQPATAPSTSQTEKPQPPVSTTASVTQDPRLVEAKEYLRTGGEVKTETVDTGNDDFANRRKFRKYGYVLHSQVNARRLHLRERYLQ